jgi:hypothetical protein
MFEECTSPEHRSVEHIYVGKGLNAKYIYIEMYLVYGGKCLPRKAVHNWVEEFSQGRSKVADRARTRHSVEIASAARVQRVEKLMPADSMIRTISIATALGCSRGLAYSIMHDHLKFRKVSVLE